MRISSTDQKVIRSLVEERFGSRATSSVPTLLATAERMIKEAEARGWV